MFSTLRNRFGIPGVISVIALVFAMFGGAYAASNSGDGKSATASAKKKAAKGPRGPKGATGATGPAGAAGPAGANGKDGAAGLSGEDGATGPKGATGATGTNGAAGTTGATGAAGATGATGPEGSPWTDGGTLPPGETETGAWSLGPLKEKEISEGLGDIQTTISFPIPLAVPLDGANVHYVKAGETAPSGCTGGTSENPVAEPGHLCVYTSVESGAGWLAALDIKQAGSTTSQPGSSEFGALLQGTATAKGAFGRGTFAVTAPTS